MWFTSLVISCSGVPVASFCIRLVSACDSVLVTAEFMFASTTSCLDSCCVSTRVFVAVG